MTSCLLHEWFEWHITCRQFRYAQFNPSDYKYSTQLGVILKREYPGIVLDMDEHGRTLHTRPAIHWEDYYLNENDAGETNADRVKEEFWVNAYCLP